MIKKINTTVIGSYPIKIDNFNLIKSYYENKSLSFNKYIKKAVDDMVSAGITIISDGQIRDPFVNIFYRKINGIRIRNRPEVIDKIAYNGEITIDDQKYVRSIIPKKIKIIGLIAGPYTLARSCIDNFYKDEEKLSYDFAEVLRIEAENLERYVDYISIDEPFFSVSMPDYAKELVDIILKNIKIKKRLHVCGDVSKIIPSLLDMPVDILSHEFKAKPKLIDQFMKYSINKEICFGSVRSDIKKVETVKEIKNHILIGFNAFGKKITQISPDCGLRQMSRENAYNKLNNLVKACGELYD